MAKTKTVNPIKKFKKDKNAPKKPLTAYFVFMNENRGKIKEDHPGKKVTEIGKLLGQKWRALTLEEKDGYNKKAAKLKVEYQKKAAKYNKSDEKKQYDEEKATWIKKEKKKLKKEKKKAKKVSSSEEEDDGSQSGNEDSDTEEESE